VQVTEWFHSRVVGGGPSVIRVRRVGINRRGDGDQARSHGTAGIVARCTGRLVGMRVLTWDGESSKDGHGLAGIVARCAGRLVGMRVLTGRCVSGAALMGEVHADRPTRTGVRRCWAGLAPLSGCRREDQDEEAKGLRTRDNVTKSGIGRRTSENQGLRGGPLLDVVSRGRSNTRPPPAAR
jgi:hypothetical protein